jgi:hypothetical protein
MPARPDEGERGDVMKRRRTAQEQKLADDARLVRAWKKFHAEEKAAVLAGPYSATLVELFRMFSAIEHVTPAQLVGFIGAIDWSAIDYQTRLTVMHEVNAMIAKFREKRGLEPINDPLPGQPDNAFRIIKNLFNSFPPCAGERAEAIGKK